MSHLEYVAGQRKHQRALVLRRSNDHRLVARYDVGGTLVVGLKFSNFSVPVGPAGAPHEPVTSDDDVAGS